MKTQPTTIEQWLNTAASALPKDVAAVTRNEISAHFADAVEDYQSAGQSLAEAHHTALADLGSAELTGRRLRDTHLGIRRYGIASAASLFTVIVLFGFPILVERMGLVTLPYSTLPLYTAFMVLLLIPAITSLAALVNLLEWRFNDEGAQRAFWLTAGGMIAYTTFDILTLALYGYSVGTWSGHSLFVVSSAVEIIFGLIVLLGQLAAAVGLIMFAARMRIYRHSMNGLGIPLFFSIALLSLSVAGMAVAVTAESHPLEMGFNVINQLGHLLVWPSLTLMFFYAVYRPHHPLPIRFI